MKCFVYDKKDNRLIAMIPRVIRVERCGDTLYVFTREQCSLFDCKKVKTRVYQN